MSPSDVKPVAGAIKPEKPTAKITDAAKVKKYLKDAGKVQAKIDKLAWGKSDEIIESVVKLHGGKLEDYKAGGLG